MKKRERKQYDPCAPSKVINSGDAHNSFHPRLALHKLYYIINTDNQKECPGESAIPVYMHQLLPFILGIGLFIDTRVKRNREHKCGKPCKYCQREYNIMTPAGLRKRKVPREQQLADHERHYDDRDAPSICTVPSFHIAFAVITKTGIDHKLHYPRQGEKGSSKKYIDKR